MALKPDRLAEHYVRAYGLCAVYLAAAGDPDKAPGIVGATRNLSARLRRLRHAHGRRAAIVCHWWCASEADAKRLVEACREYAGPAALFCQSIPIIARRLDIGLTPGETVIRRASEAVQSVQERLEEMKRSGELRQLHARYKMERKLRAAQGRATEPYPAFLRRYAIGLLYDMAAEVRGRTQRR